MSDKLGRKLTAEWLGTFWLVLGGCGSAVFSATFPELGIGILGVSLAFGLSVVTAAYAFGGVSGAHLNPAVTLGLCVAGRFPARHVLPYVLAQVLGAVAAAAMLYLLFTGRLTPAPVGGFAANGYAEHSPGNYKLWAALVAEVVMTFMFVMIILGATAKRAAHPFAPLAIGLTLTLIHLVTIPITNTSVNPARSTGPALIVGGWALDQLWLFWIAPLLGGAAAGLLYRALFEDEHGAERAAPSAA